MHHSQLYYWVWDRDRDRHIYRQGTVKYDNITGKVEDWLCTPRFV